MNKISFNLLEDSWVPCEMRSKEFKMLSIKDVLFNANNILEISSDNPLIVISIYRLLLAILHRNFGPKNKVEWKAIYNAGKWDKNALEQYFIKWKQRFDLFNEPENRFYQIKPPEITNKTPITKLNHAMTSGHSTALFDHNWDSNISSMNAEDTAQLLVAFQNFAVGGGKSSPFNYSHAPLISSIIILLKGKDLFETLMLNFIRYDQHHPFVKSEDYKDMPFWERNDKSLHKEKAGRFPHGYLDYLTWQSRRIWLIPMLEDGKIKVKYMFMAQGEKLKVEWKKDPQMVYKLDNKNQLKSINFIPDRQVWRDTEALLRLNDSDSKFISPKAINWVSIFVSEKIIPPSRRYNLGLYGLCNDPSKAAKIVSWHRSNIPLPLKYLEDPSLVDNVKSFVEKCETVGRILNSTLYFFGKAYLFPDESSLNRNQQNKINDFIQNYQIRIKYWNLIEKYFYKFMEEIAQEPDFEKRQSIIKKWVNEHILKTARDLLNTVKINIRSDPRALKPYIQNVGYFFKHSHSLKQ